MEHGEVLRPHGAEKFNALSKAERFNALSRAERFNALSMSSKSLPEFEQRSRHPVEVVEVVLDGEI
jgi:hypothetical protein